MLQLQVRRYKYGARFALTENFHSIEGIFQNSYASFCRWNRQKNSSNAINIFHLVSFFFTKAIYIFTLFLYFYKLQSQLFSLCWVYSKRLKVILQKGSSQMICRVLNNLKSVTFFTKKVHVNLRSILEVSVIKINFILKLSRVFQIASEGDGKFCRGIFLSGGGNLRSESDHSNFFQS